LISQRNNSIDKISPPRYEVPMETPALTTVLEEIKKLNSRMDKRDAKEDDRFEFIKSQFHTLDAKVDDQGNAITQIQKSVETIALQTALSVSEIQALKFRVSKLEGPSA
jgi:hypothetical protein